jgi:hypothetical protein
MFQFNSERFDFWEIYESIKSYYPLGIKKEATTMFFSYPGFKALTDIIVDNIHDESHFIERWENVAKGLGLGIGREMIGTTYGQTPSFSSYILLNKESVGNLTRTKELHFFVSLVGPFYTVIGQDNNQVKLGDLGFFSSTNYIVVSPEIDFAEPFKLLCANIENQFKGFRFVPFEICKQTIDGLDVKYSDDNLNAVFHALFNDQVDLSIRSIIGNTFFKSEDWNKEGYVDNGDRWTSRPPII